MKYDFDTAIAKQVGVEEAIMHSNILRWCKKNEVEESTYHFFDGKYWTFNSVKAWTELFPFRSIQQIRRILDNLEKASLIESKQIKARDHDMTKWYRCICGNQQIGSVETNKGYIGTDSKQQIESKEDEVIDTDKPVTAQTPTPTPPPAGKKKKMSLQDANFVALKHIQSLEWDYEKYALGWAPLLNKYQEWLEYKSERGELYASERTLKENLDYAIKIGIDQENFIDLIQKSIANEYKGLFPLKKETSYKKDLRLKKPGTNWYFADEVELYDWAMKNDMRAGLFLTYGKDYVMKVIDRKWKNKEMQARGLLPGEQLYEIPTDIQPLPYK